MTPLQAVGLTILVILAIAIVVLTFWRVRYTSRSIIIGCFSSIWVLLSMAVGAAILWLTYSH